MTRPRGLFQVGLLAGLLLGGCVDAPPQLVVFAVMDAARGDRMSWAGYPRATTPFLESLAEQDSLTALSHFSQGAATRSAIPRLFYSRYFVPPLFPASSKVPITGPLGLFSRRDDRAISLPEVFSDSGFTTIGVSAHTWLTQGSELATLFDQFHDLSSTHSGAYPEAPEVVDKSLSVLAETIDQDVFVYLHFMDTHLPYRFGQRARAFFGDREAPASFSPADASKDPDHPLTTLEKDYYDALYDGSLRRIDDELRRLMQTLMESHKWGRVSLVVTSDHGEHLGEVPGRSTHGGRWFDAVGHIPLLMFAPGALSEARSIELPTESVDVVPTLVDLFDLSVADGMEFDGRSLLGDGTDGIALAPDAIRTANEKVLGITPDKTLWIQEHPPELFLLESDPLETKDLSSQHQERVKQLVELHERRLSYSFHRFRNAKSGTPPEQPFAISSRSFSVPSLAEGQPAGQRSGWIQITDSGTYRLSCVETPCGEIELSFPMPNGEYAVTIGHLGSAELAIEGGEPAGWIELDSADEVVDPKQIQQPWRHDLDTSSGGSVTVTNQRFKARLRASRGSGISIRHIGFVPAGAELDPDREDYEARLKALGYVQ